MNLLFILLKIAAMIDAGIGEAQLNTVLSALNIPPLTATILKRYERIVGRVIETVAKNSCHESIKLEKAMYNNNGETATSSETVTQQIE